MEAFYLENERFPLLLLEICSKHFLNAFITFGYFMYRNSYYVFVFKFLPQ